VIVVLNPRFDPDELAGKFIVLDLFAEDIDITSLGPSPGHWPTARRSWRRLQTWRAAQTW
jgi:hypothetical protein